MDEKGQKQVETIPLPPGAFETLQDAQQKLAAVQGQLNSYIAGLRQGLSVPEGWKIDMRLRAFVSADGQGKAEEAGAAPAET